MFEDKAISPFMYAYDEKPDGVEESEQTFEESIGERVKCRRQRADNKIDEADNYDEKSRHCKYS